MGPNEIASVNGALIANGNCASQMFRELFQFRQGLWTEDLRIPPGQECSNGSLILFAVVLWRTF